jgi:hypothetical protein
MDRLRQFINEKPWLGWAMAAALLVVSLVLYYRLSGGSDPHSIARLSQMVTIRCAETGDEWQMNRGMLEKALLERPLPIDPNVGLQNPNTGKFTGFPVDSVWKSTIDRLNKERAEAAEQRKLRDKGRK